MISAHLSSFAFSRAAPIAFAAAAFVGGCGSESAWEPNAAEPASIIGCAGGGGSSGSGGTAGSSGVSIDASMSDVGLPSLDARVDERGPAPRDARMDEPFVPGPPYVAPPHQGNLVHVKNGCSFPLWIHGVGGGAVLAPDNLKLNAGEMHDYAVGDWPFAWVTAYVDGPQQNMIERAELTMFPAGVVSYRLAYIDGIGLPMELQAIGSGSDCKRVGCYVPEAEVVAQCPDGLLSGKRCRSAGVYCNDAANAMKPYCHALDAAIAKCAQNVPGCQGAAGATTPNAYACERSFGDVPNVCAALNRGMLDDPTSSSDASFYQTPPYNSYAAWLHALCPGLYAFAYDDVKTSADPFHTCQNNTNSTQLNITFCPAG
jgi:hypothetical protein